MIIIKTIHMLCLLGSIYYLITTFHGNETTLGGLLLVTFTLILIWIDSFNVYKEK